MKKVSVVRKIGKGFGGFLFTTFLSLSILTLVMIEFTEYENLKPVAFSLFSNVMKSGISKSQITEIYNNLRAHCEANPEKMEEFSINNKTIIMNCSKILEGTQEDFIDMIFEKQFNFDEIYYKEYDCEFIECISSGDSEAFTVILSAEANKFFREFLYYVLIGTVIGGAILAVSCKGFEIFRSFGYSCVVMGVPFFFMNILQGFIESRIPSETLSILSPIIGRILNSISDKLLVVFIVGVILLVIGYVGSYLKRRKKK